MFYNLTSYNKAYHDITCTVYLSVNITLIVLNYTKIGHLSSANRVVDSCDFRNLKFFPIFFWNLLHNWVKMSHHDVITYINRKKIQFLSDWCRFQVCRWYLGDLKVNQRNSGQIFKPLESTLKSAQSVWNFVRIIFSV